MKRLVISIALLSVFCSVSGRGLSFTKIDGMNPKVQIEAGESFATTVGVEAKVGGDFYFLLVEGVNTIGLIEDIKPAIYAIKMDYHGEVIDSRRTIAEREPSDLYSDSIWVRTPAHAFGDINGDGTTDIVNGYPSENTVHLLLTKPDGEVEQAVSLATLAAHKINLSERDRFGHSVAIGDVDKNGTTDFVVGVPGYDGTGIDQGAVYIILMNPGIYLKQVIKIDGPTLGINLGDKSSFGTSVTVGNIGPNNPMALMVGASAINSGEEQEQGEVYIISMNRDFSSVKNVLKIDNSTMGGELSNYALFGESIAVMDMDQDDWFDLLVVGAPGDYEKMKNHSGAVYLFRPQQNREFFANFLP